MLAGFRYTSQFRWIGNSPWTSNDVEILLKTRKIPTKPSNPSAPPPGVPRLGTVATESGESGTAILMSMASPQSGGE